ncbi:hemolysin XhlA family protein [Bacillus vallismortis]|uniref:Hemolysin XhlA family protein n=1 Tax=Bacillus vallismortis TaxID=72361 RepID=A0AAP3FUF6_BACVA|nr:hemolysin XhlA family protein [Bacillus vallismortis]MBG9770108.1 protein xhlA [Bacillus vallismortis]MCI3985860.1 hemolysin XhlA family protein [Bacillus vallismortis]MCI4135745.1 hemolysin XhlA family protein [Bacillus vallismortis]MCY8308104.1 hemolysin XhlA family protein [Bacillus vallismortis]MCY8316747.1 hemolysin XhlA family protein [Bacillus vallismortis]
MQQEVDVNVFQQDLTDIKGEHKALEQRVSVLERVSDRQDQQIMTLNEKLNKIDENTTWIKRTITGAMITAVCTGIIGGAIAIMYNLLQQ